MKVQQVIELPPLSILLSESVGETDWLLTWSDWLCNYNSHDSWYRKLFLFIYCQILNLGSSTILNPHDSSSILINIDILWYLHSPLPFSQVVKAIAGEDGVAICRSLFDGIEDDGEGELQSRVTEGRCTGECCLSIFYPSIINLCTSVLSSSVCTMPSILPSSVHTPSSLINLCTTPILMSSVCTPHHPLSCSSSNASQ